MCVLALSCVKCLIRNIIEKDALWGFSPLKMTKV